MDGTNQPTRTNILFQKKNLSNIAFPSSTLVRNEGGRDRGPFAIITPTVILPLSREREKNRCSNSALRPFSLDPSCEDVFAHILPLPKNSLVRSGSRPMTLWNFVFFPPRFWEFSFFLCRVRFFPREKVRKRERESVSLTDSILLRLDIGHVFFWEMCGRGMSANWKTRKKFFSSRPRLCKEKTLLLFCPPLSPLFFLGKPSYKIPLCYYAK